MINKILSKFGFQLLKIDNDNVTKTIKELLLKKNLKQEDLVQLLGIKKSMLSQAINGRPKSFPLMQKKILAYLKSL